MLIKRLKNDPSLVGKSCTISGWVKTLRKQKNFSFLEVNDGSAFTGLQIILEESLPGYEELVSKISTGASIRATGTLQESPGQRQSIELKAEELELLGSCPPEEYPLQKKRHSFEFLREIGHLRPRTNTQGAVARIRSKLAFEVHRFFQERDFLYLQSPVITGSDCEGGGQLFQVTTLLSENLPLTPERRIDFSKDFFHRPAYLTVSGQLNAEAFACALSRVYTFGPTFRAEPSNTSRHLAEFWMVEPEIAFIGLEDLKKLSESFIKHLVQCVRQSCEEDLLFFDQFIEKGLIGRLDAIISADFAHMTYTEAIEVLNNSGKAFEFPHTWGADLQSEHERFLAEEYCKRPVFITDYPKSLKAFYMRDNEDGKTVAALDLLVPKIGEIIGGSVREERFDVMKQKFESHHLDQVAYKWYLDLRYFGTAPHGGFGLGFERCLQFLTGMENIRDVIAFPRYPGHAEF